MLIRSENVVFFFKCVIFEFKYVIFGLKNDIFGFKNVIFEFKNDTFFSNASLLDSKMTYSPNNTSFPELGRCRGGRGRWRLL